MVAHAQTAYSYVGGQIAALIPRFDLLASRQQIQRSYEIVGRESLAYPFGSRPVHYSRINRDGTPFQYALTLGSPYKYLQFLAEVGPIGLPGAERMRVSRDCLTTLAKNLKAEEGLKQATELLDSMAPATSTALLTESAGAFWIGLGFSAAREPKLKIYINVKWGSNRDRWKRLGRFAAHFGVQDSWQKIANTVADDLDPLGAAITLRGERTPSGRIYLTTYGRYMAYYEELAQLFAGESFGRALGTYARIMLGNDHDYPTQTAVCSFGIASGRALDFKFELCGHSLFANDVTAASRLRSWFATAGQDAAVYSDLLEIISEGYLSNKAANLHSYVGIGQKKGAIYSTAYLKPRLKAVDVC